MTNHGRRAAARFAVTLLLVAVALFAQRYYIWDDGHALGGSDAQSYEAMALAAPAMPPGQLAFHGAQRWVGPYIVGLIANSLGTDVRGIFRLASGVCLLGAILLMHASLLRIGVSLSIHAICMAMFVFHYSLRFYLVAPGMLPDVFFIFGLALTLYGLACGRIWVVLAGVIFAGLARQTVVLLIPGITYYLIRGEGWAPHSTALKTGNALAVAILAAFVYIGTGIVAAPFAEPPENLQAVTALFSWLAGPNFALTDLLVFAAYPVVALMIPSAMIVAAFLRLAGAHAGLRWPGELLGSLLMAAAIVSQPLLGGPEYTGNGNAMRLAALGLAPLALALAFLLKHAAFDEAVRVRTLPVILLLATGSLHYNYTLIGPSAPVEFAAIQLTIAGTLAWLIFWRSGAARNRCCAIKS